MLLLCVQGLLTPSPGPQPCLHSTPWQEGYRPEAQSFLKWVREPQGPLVGGQVSELEAAWRQVPPSDLQIRLRATFFSFLLAKPPGASLSANLGTLLLPT